MHQLLQLTQAKREVLHGQMFYLADYDSIEVLDWGRRVQAAFGAAPIRQVPMAALRLVAGAGDGLAWLGWKNVSGDRFDAGRQIAVTCGAIATLRSAKLWRCWSSPSRGSGTATNRATHTTTRRASRLIRK